MKRVLIYGGKTGWIGGLMADLVKKEEGIECFLSEVRIENREDVAKELDEILCLLALLDVLTLIGKISVVRYCVLYEKSPYLSSHQR